MPGPVTKDSLSRCDSPSTLYDTIRNPYSQSTPKPAIERVPVKDTIESTQQKMNREMLERLQRGGLQLPHESFVAAVQVGKYLVLAIMLPPYLCLYGIPRWMIVNLIPQLFLVVKNESLRIGNFMQEIAKNIADIMKGILEQMLGDALRMGSRYSRSVWNKFSARSKSLMNGIKNPLERRIANAKNEAKRFINDLLDKSKEALQNLLDQAHQKLEFVKGKAAKEAKQAKEAIQNNVVDPSMKYFQRHFAAFASQVRANEEKISRFANALQRQLKKVFGPISDAAEGMAKNLRKRGRNVKEIVLEPLFEMAKEKIESTRLSLAMMWQEATSPISEAASAVHSKARSLVAAGLDVSAQALQWSPAASSQIAFMIWKNLPEKTQKRLSRHRKTLKRFGRGMNMMKTAVVVGIQGCVHGGKASARILNSFIAQLIRKILDLMAWLGRHLLIQLKSFPDRARVAMRIFMKYARKSFRGLALGMRLMIACLWAICGYSWIMARELFVEIDRWFSPKTG